MLRSRCGTAIIGIPLLLLIVYLGGLFWFGFILLLGLLSAKELKNIMNRKEIQVWSELFYGWLIIFLPLVMFQKRALSVALFLLLLYGCLRLVLTYPSSNLINLGASFCPFFYLVFPLSTAITLRNLPSGLIFTYLLFAFVWTSDTAAFFIGKRWGTHFFLPEVSPHKTIEGSIGAIIATGIIGCISAYLIHWPLFLGLIIGIFSSILGQLGDLFESVLKRWGELKDSGNVFPGHGGVLDRFDSFLFTVPFIYFLANFLRG